MTGRFDAIVVGSGFGGAVAACRLAEAGRRVLVLERGRRWDVADYPSVTNDDWLWDNDAPEKQNGWIDLRVFPRICVVQGAGVGGGSLIYANVSIKAEANAFQNGWPPEINSQSLDPYYDKVGAMLDVRPVPDNQETERCKLVRDAAEATGYGQRFRKLELAVSFDPEWSYERPDPHNPVHSKTFVNPHGRQQGTCIHCGHCDIGCPVNAKNTLDNNYLARAETAGAEIRPLHGVNKITPIDAGYAVYFERYEGGQAIAGQIEANEIYLGAGSIGSTELLLRCRDVHRTLPHISRQLGAGWSSNGDFLTPARYPNRRISPTKGPTISGTVSFLDGAVGGHEFFLQDGGCSDAVGLAIQESIQKYPLLRQVIELIWKDPEAALRNRDPFDNTMPWFGQSVDGADGRLAIKSKWYWPWSRKLDLDWDPAGSEEAINALIDMHKRFSEATGGRVLVPPSWTLLKYLITPHPLGGCCMGRSDADGVVNHAGEVFHYPGLYVVDGAVIPRPLGLNPSRTIAAVAEYMLHQKLSR